MPTLPSNIKEKQSSGRLNCWLLRTCYYRLYKERAKIENRLGQLEAQQDALEIERRSLHEAIQTLREQHRQQGKVSTYQPV